MLNDRTVPLAVTAWIDPDASPIRIVDDPSVPVETLDLDRFFDPNEVHDRQMYPDPTASPITIDFDTPGAIVFDYTLPRPNQSAPKDNWHPNESAMDDWQPMDDGEPGKTSWTEYKVSLLALLIH